MSFRARGLALILALGLCSQPVLANDRPGLTELTIGQSINSVFISIESAYLLNLYYRQVVGMSLMLFSAGVILPNVLTQGRALSSIRARNINSASLWGGLNGMLLGLAIDYDELRWQAGFGLGLNTVATTVTAFTSNTQALSQASLVTMHSTALWGIAFGYGIYQVADTDLRHTPKFLWAGHTLGLVGGYLLAQQNNISETRMVQINLISLLSGLGTYTIFSLAGIDYTIKWVATLASVATAAVLTYSATDHLARPTGGHVANYNQAETTVNFSIPPMQF